MCFDTCAMVITFGKEVLTTECLDFGLEGEGTVSGPANFFFSSLLNSTLFVFRPLFLTQLHFLFCLSISHAPFFSIYTFLMLIVVPPHSILMSMFLHCTMPHSTQNNLLVSSLVFSLKACRKCFFSYCKLILLVLFSL